MARRPSKLFGPPVDKRGLLVTLPLSLLLLDWLTIAPCGGGWERTNLSRLLAEPTFPPRALLESEVLGAATFPPTFGLELGFPTETLDVDCSNVLSC